MSVMVLNKAYFERIGKYLSLRMSEERAKDHCIAWHELNIRNYCKRYERHGETFQGLEFTRETLSLDVPIPAAVQVERDLSALYYNCIDYGQDIMPKALQALEDQLEKVRGSKEYEFTKQFSDSVMY